MRLQRIKLAGFKSFVDPTSVHVPGNLTGVVGPNGCGKSNIIDAVRWVMGELSARYLRGDSMADVIFNGSSARKSVGTASVELVFDNHDGRIGGAYAGYSEISLKRVVERDGTSGYFINGGRCRRRDITALFLGTGLGSRSYAIIEQGTISRVIEARADDMRAFIEEAAGISLYKERRRETESRIGDTRENLARLNDLREEVDKQIRHLQRQAGAARRYQEFKTRERNLTAELLALKLRELDAGAAEQDHSVRACELSMQQALADQRATEAAIEKQREFHEELGAALSQVQARYYELGAQVTRTEESIRYSRELRERAGSELEQVGQGLGGVTDQIARDEQQLAQLRAEIAELAPLLDSRRAEEQRCAGALAQLEGALAEWQQRWEVFNRELGTASQSAQVEAARIEQLEGQRHRLQAQADRLAQEGDTLAAQAAESALGGLAEREAEGRSLAETLAQQLSGSVQQVQQLRGAQQAADGRLERLRHEREQVRSELMSLEALQKAALREKNPRTGAWLAALPAVAGRPRLAETLDVQQGWERAVETVLGDYLEAVGVEGLEQLEGALPQLPTGQLTFFEADHNFAGAAGGSSSAEPADPAGAGTLAAQVRGPALVRALLGRVHTAASLADALRRRAGLSDGESLITAEGEWLGRGWLRVNRGGDVHAGVLEREHRLKGLRERCGVADARVRELEQEIVAVRAQVGAAEQHRDRLQARIQEAQHEHSELRSQLEAHKARAEQATLRHQRIEAEQAEVAAEAERTRESLDKARNAYDGAIQTLAVLDEQRRSLEEERELRREQLTAARARAQGAQLELRDAMVRLEGRRSAEGSMGGALERLVQQRESLQRRREELERSMAEAIEPLAQLERDLQEHLSRRHEAEVELAGARRRLEDG
ncbi:MAG: chromosome segregation protein SMC, partial [Steroidobacteraceae bacterium]